MVYYLGCNGDAPLMPKWNKASPAFYVDEVDHDVSKSVRAKLPHSCIRYLGSHQGCGCGFRSERDGILIVTEGDDAIAESADHASLVMYLKNLPPEISSAQIFGCWSGDEGEELDHHRECVVDELGGSEFAFREREIVVVKLR
jgi:hypothetical protein